MKRREVERLSDHNARRRKPQHETIHFKSTSMSSIYEGRQQKAGVVSVQSHLPSSRLPHTISMPAQNSSRLLQRKGSEVQKDAVKIPVASYIFRNSLKLKSSDAEMVVRLHEAVVKFMTLFPLIISNDEKIAEVSWKREIIDVPAASKLRILLGLFLREIKDFWRPALLLSTLLYYNDIDSTNSLFENSKLDKRIVLFNQVEDAVNTQGLDKIWEVKPLVNGKEIMSILQLKTGGPLVREWVEKLLEWQLAHPSGSAEECIEWMRQAQSKRARME